MLKPSLALNTITVRFLGAVRYWGFQRGHLSKRSISLALGKSENYLNVLLSGKQPFPAVDTMEFIVSQVISADWLMLGRGSALRNGLSPEEFATLPHNDRIVETPSGRFEADTPWHFDWATGTASPAIKQAA